MSQKIKKFIIGRIKSLKYAAKGFFLLIGFEHAVISHSTGGLLLCGLGFYYHINRIEWMLQILSIGLILSIEGINTAVEALCDFIHPAYNKKIGYIKDISAGAVAFAGLASAACIILIYYPYIIER